MDISTMEFIIILLICVSAGIVLGLTACFVMLNQYRHACQSQIKKIESTVNIMTSGSLGMGQKMLTLEKKVSNLRHAQNEMKVSDVDFSYTQAQKLIAQGMDSRAIAANSGLSASEINLMRLLHQHHSDGCARV
ncbi:DUF2802 domain-containing protein [Agarilytica rhodophyticola]|uniref:DUF2802 domain-containing protein n=1 Tax=Agarilytica rhodophyticola TaxID=1737490 RepID=UPI000B3485BE|nr:DUF2802 domain-containing protein [Agarilytica rhodophyticola]